MSVELPYYRAIHNEISLFEHAYQHQLPVLIISRTIK